MVRLEVMQQVSVLGHSAQVDLQIQDLWSVLQDQLPKHLRLLKFKQEHLANDHRKSVSIFGSHCVPKRGNLHKLKSTSSNILGMPHYVVHLKY